MSTSFLVIQAQRDLAIARNGELQALLDYQLAVIAFETSQQTSTARICSSRPPPFDGRSGRAYSGKRSGVVSASAGS